jgi:hypothetical protein
MLFTIENVGFGGGSLGVETGVAGGLSGVGVGFLSGVGELISSLVGLGEGDARILGPGVEDGYFALRSLFPLREINQAAKTPATATTRTIANIHGRALLRDSLRPRSSADGTL